MSKIANIRWFCFDWKEHVKGSDLAKAIKEVEKCGHGSKVIDDAVNTGSDCLVTLVVPESYQHSGKLSEDIGDLFGWANLGHVDANGDLWFKIDAQCGMPATDWLIAKDATTWIEGLMASDELSNKYTPKGEKAEFQKIKEKALKLLNR